MSEITCVTNEQYQNNASTYQGCGVVLVVSPTTISNGSETCEIWIATPVWMQSNQNFSYSQVEYELLHTGVFFVSSIIPEGSFVISLSPPKTQTALGVVSAISEILLEIRK